MSDLLCEVTIPPFSKKRPLNRGDVIRNPNGKHFKVLRSKRRECHDCGGTGRLWKITLRGDAGKFETEFANLAKGNYVRVPKPAVEEK